MAGGHRGVHISTALRLLLYTSIISCISPTCAATHITNNIKWRHRVAVVGIGVTAVQQYWRRATAADDTLKNTSSAVDDVKGFDSSSNKTVSTAAPLDDEEILLNDPRFKKLIEALDLKYGNSKTRSIRKAIRIFNEIANELDSISAQALYELGDTHLYGTEGFRGIRRDVHKALSYFNQSALCGFGPALHIMSFCVASGVGNTFPPNEKAATRLEYLASMTNYLPAIMGMGFRFLYGHGVRQNCELALKHYKFAAEAAIKHDDGVLRYPLGSADRFGDKTTELAAQTQQLQSQEGEIMQYWEHQAKGGDPMAQYELAKLRETGDAASKKEVTSLYKKAADQGLAPAIRDLGASYLQGIGVERDVTKGMENLHKAADMGDSEALNFLGYIYLFGDEQSFGVKRNIHTAKQFFTKAAIQDYPESLFFLGELQINAHSNSSVKLTDEDYRLAIRLYERAADYGYIQAYWRVAQLYELGKGVPRSCEAAALAYKYVAESGPWVTDIRRGMTYFLQRDYEGALLTNSLYAEEGYEVAQSNTAWLYKNVKVLTGKDVASKSLRMQYLSHLQGNPDAIYEIGDIYLHGRGDVTKDVDTAIKSMKLALQRGDLRALTALAGLYEKGTHNISKDYDKAEKLLLYALEELRKSDDAYHNTIGSKPTMKQNVTRLSRISSIVAQLAKIRMKRRLSKRNS